MTQPAAVSQRYELVERIAVGGMAEVFKAKSYGSHGFEKIIAIKRILPEMAADPEFERRFISEAKIAVTLNHANIVQVLDFSRVGSSLYIAMEYIDGLDLAALNKACRPIPVAAALYAAIEMLKGLSFAHGRGVVHRDVSPSNVLVSTHGEVKIADFGIAQAGDAGLSLVGNRRIMGKWRYMSPEQAIGERLDARSDLFSAGSVIFELFTGEKLFAGDDPEEIVRSIRERPVKVASKVRPGLPPEIDDVLELMLVRDRLRRTVTAEECLRRFIDISYEQTLHATAMSLADVVARARKPEQQVVVPTADRSQPPAGIDDIIMQELNGGGERTEQSVVLRRTVNDPREPLMETEGKDGDGRAITGFDVVPASEGASMSQWRLVAADAEEGADPERAPTGLFEEPPVRRRTAVGVAEHNWPREEPMAPAELEQVTFEEAAEQASTRPMPRRRRRFSAQGFDASVAGRRGWRRWSLPAAALALLLGATAVLGWSARDRVGAADARTEHGERRGTGAAPVTPSARAVPQTAGPRARPPMERHPAAADVADGGAATVATGTTALTVRSDPPGAAVYLGDELVGETPLSRSLPASGEEVTVRLELDGYRGYRRQVTLSAGKVAVRRALDPVVEYGTVDIFSEPWANVYLRGRKVGVVPKRGLKLPVGTHQLVLVNPVKQLRKQITVVVPSERSYRVRLD